MDLINRMRKFAKGKILSREKTLIKIWCIVLENIHKLEKEGGHFVTCPKTEEGKKLWLGVSDKCQCNIRFYIYSHFQHIERKYGAQQQRRKGKVRVGGDDKIKARTSHRLETEHRSASGLEDGA